MRFTKEKVSNKYCWPPPRISKNMDDPKRTYAYVEKEQFLRVGSPIPGKNLMPGILMNAGP
jgi:hypothetical protein